MAKTRQITKKPIAKKPVTKDKNLSADKKQPFNRADYWSTEELANHARVTNAQVSHWKSKGIIKPAITGSKKEGDFYKPFETVFRLMRYYQDGAKESEEIKYARERHLKAKARQEELDLEEREGKLHKADDIIHAVGVGISRLRINLLAIPKSVAPQIVDEKNINIISEKIYDRIAKALDEITTLDINKLLEEEEK